MTFSVIADKDRSNFLPRHWGNDFLRVERLIFDTAGKCLAGYSGGYWEYLQNEDGSAGYVRLSGADTVTLSSDWTELEMSSDAAGLAITMHVTNQLLWRHADNQGFLKESGERLANLYHQLEDAAREHPESGKIWAYLD